MSDVFKRLEKEEARTLFKDEAMFSADYTPQSLDEVKYREEQIKEIARCIRNTMKGVRSELCVFGAPSIGKTYIVKAVLKCVPKEWAEKFQYAWLNCRSIYPLSGFQIMNEVSAQLDRSWKKGYATKDIEDWVIRRHKEKPLIIVFDEVDVLARKSDRFLYTFFDHGVSQILISNVFDWVNDVDMRIKSRSKDNRVDFGAYSKEEILGILKFIADKGLEDGVVSDEILEELAKQTHDNFAGDLRKGKYLLAACVDEAMKEGVDRVTLEHIGKAYKRVQPMRLKDILKNFSLPERVALAGFVMQRETAPINRNAPATTGNVYHYYEECAKLNGLEPVGETMMKNYLERLEGSELLAHETVSHKSRGRTNVYYSPKYDIRELAWALYELGVKFLKLGSLSEVFGGKNHEIFG